MLQLQQDRCCFGAKSRLIIHNNRLGIMKARRTGLGIAYIPLLVSVCVLAGCGGGSVASHMAKAQKFYGEAKYRSAMIEYKNVLQKKPSEAMARLGLGQSYLALGDFADAQEQFQRAQKLGVVAAKVTLPLARALIQQGDFAKALSLIDANKDALKGQDAEVATLQGDALLGQNMPDKAGQAYAHALDRDPQLVLAKVGQARIAAMHNDWALARKKLDQAISVDAENAKAWMFRGQVDFQQHELKLAEGAFEKVATGEIQHDTTPQLRFMARVYLTDAQIALGQLSSAQHNVDTLLKQSPKHPLANYLQARLDVHQKKLSDAVDHLQTALQGAPKYLPALALLGAVKLQQGETAQAQMYLSSAVSLNPGSSQLRQLLADAQLKHSVPDPGATPPQLAQAGPARARGVNLTEIDSPNGGDLGPLQQKASQAPDNPGLQFTLAQALLERGQGKQALSVLNRVPDSDTVTGLTRDRLRIAAYLRTRNLSAALDEVKKMIKAHPKDVDAYVLASDVYMIANHNDDAKQAIDKAKTIAPHASKVLMTSAVLAMRMGQQAQAQADFHSILAESPKSVDAMMGLARLAAMANDAGDATKWLKQAAAAAPKALAPRIVLVRLYILQKEPAKALSVAQDAVKIAPDNATALNLLGAAQWSSGHKDDALDSFGNAIKAAPDNMAFRLHLARAQIGMNKNVAAEKTLNAIVDRQPGMVQASQLLAAVQMRQGHDKAAFATAEQLGQQSGAEASAAQLEGDLYMQQKKYDQAAQAYAKSLQAKAEGAVVAKDFVARVRAGIASPEKPLIQWLSGHGNDVAIRSLLAQWYLGQNALKLAQEQYEQIVKLNPKNATALNNLAWIYGQQNDPKAIEFAQKAHEAAPDSPSVSDTLGWLEFQAGHADKALPLLQGAAAQASDNPSIQYHWAAAQAKTGDKDGARKTLKKLLATNKAFPERSEAEQLLQQLKGG